MSKRTFVKKFSHSRFSKYVCKNLLILARLQMLTTRLNSFGTWRFVLALQPYAQRLSVTLIRFSHRCTPIQDFFSGLVTRSRWFLILFIYSSGNLTPWAQTRWNVSLSYPVLLYVLLFPKWRNSKPSYWQISGSSYFPRLLLRKRASTDTFSISVDVTGLIAKVNSKVLSMK